MKKDKSKIPHGCYCYDENGTCPYWRLIEDREYQENGWCDYMEKGDIEISEDTSEEWHIGCKDGWEEVKHEDVPRFIRMGLLWDKCKECNINMEEPIEDEEDN